MLSNDKLVAELAIEYAEMMEKVSDLTAEIKAKHREEARAEIAEKRVDLEKAFAVKFELARRAGVKRYELESPVLRTRDGAKYKYFVEMGGGVLTKLTTANDRAAQIEAADAAEKQRVFDLLGIEYVGYKDFNNWGSLFHHFKFVDTGYEFFINGRFLSATGGTTPEFIEFMKAREDDIAQLRELYKEEKK